MGVWDNDEDKLPELSDAVKSEVSVPDFKPVILSKIYDYNNSVVDYEDLEKLNSAIKEARLALFKTTNSLMTAERKEVAAQKEYERKYRRALLSSTEKTAENRKAYASIVSEPFEDIVVKESQIRKELERISYTLRQELQALQVLGNNLRQQMKMDD